MSHAIMFQLREIWGRTGQKLFFMTHPKYRVQNSKNSPTNTSSKGEFAMRIWFDTEFIEDGKTIDLLSIGMVREDGAELYMENNQADLSRGSDWVQHNVIVHLNWLHHGFERADIAAAVVSFAGEKPDLWAYYADYDWVVLCQLFGTMMDLPKGWPMYCRDVKQLCDSLGNPKLPEQSSTEHHALADAKWTREAWKFLQP